MLHFFARRMKEAREDERGFTLIELLVVVIIIGILAAIAIPVFLSQTAKAQDSAAQSDLRNMSAAATAYMADKGNYDGMTKAILDSTYGFNPTTGDNGPTVSEVTVAADKKSWKATATSKSAKVYEFDSNVGQVKPQAE